MITLYIEPDKLEEFVLFEEEMPHWNKIINSGINLCINISDNDLDQRLQDLSDPILIAYNDSDTMELPIALEDYIKEIKEDLNQTIEKPNDIFILDVEVESANDIQKRLGMAVYSCKNVPDKLFTNYFYVEYKKDDNINGGWTGILNKVDKQLSNSLVITDNYFFQNEDGNENRGLKNIIPFLDAYLPDYLEIEYQIAIVSPNSKSKANTIWIREYGKLLAAIKLLREYPISIELVLVKLDVHKRCLVSNYDRSDTDVGFGFFKAINLEKVSQNNYFRNSGIFKDIDNGGTKNFESNIAVIEELREQIKGVSDYVRAHNNQLDKSLFGCNPDKTIKNRLLS